MKKVACIACAAAAAALFLFPAAAERGGRTEFYVRTGSSGWFCRDVSKADSSFGGAYSLFAGSVSSESFRLAAKAKMKLGSAQSAEELSSSASWEKAWAAFSVPALPELWVYGGHGFVLSVPGCFYSITDSDYADGARWGKDGLGVRWEGGAVQAGLAWSMGTSSAELRDKLSLGAGVNADLSALDVPLSLGLSLTYDNARNSVSRTTVTDYGRLFRDSRDYALSVFAQAKPVPDATVSAGYTLNAAPMVTSAIFKHVEFPKENKSAFSPLDHSHVGVLVARVRALGATFDANVEAARAFDGGLWSLYAAVRAKRQVFEAGGWKFSAFPDARLFAIGGAGGDGRRSLVLRPCVTAEAGRHYIKFGAEIERREVSDGVFHWLVSIPAYYKFSL